MSNSGECESVALFDRQALWLEALEQLLTRHGIEVVAKTTTVDAALSAVVERQPDVFVSEVYAEPGGNRYPGVRAAKELYPGIRIVALGASEDPALIEEVFEAGADVYCVKTAEPDDLLAAIHQALRRSIYVARPRPEAQSSASAEVLSMLTKRELEILRLVAEGHSNLQLARMLWVTEQTVKFHLSNIYRKLEVANRTEASRWAQTHGLLPTVPESVPTA
jgi:DNA-binding NarL/FixJ family response regulator